MICIKFTHLFCCVQSFAKLLNKLFISDHITSNMEWMSYFPLLYWNSHVFTCHCLLILCLYLSWGVLCLQTYNVLGNTVCFSLWAQHFQINWRIRKRRRKVCLNGKRASDEGTSPVYLWSNFSLISPPPELLQTRVNVF